LHGSFEEEGEGKGLKWGGEERRVGGGIREFE